MAYFTIREEELKNKIAQDYFAVYDCSKIIGNIDFCVTIPQNIVTTETQSLLWAEAKKGRSDIYKSIVQLILTIGKARTFDTCLPPTFLGAFDAEKMAFVPYNDVHDIFYLNDFNWNVAPSNYDTKEFALLLEKVTDTIEQNTLLFYFEEDSHDLKTFITNNFTANLSSTTKVKIDKNNFITIYSKWLLAVKPTIAANWDIALKNGIIDGDFYLADLLAYENETLKDKLFVLLKKDHYQLDRKLNEMGFFNSSTASFIDNQKSHTLFWNKYERPPLQEYWDYIVERRDLLVPQDVRERKGSFFTPQIWVELSQQYLADTFGKDWQDEYYIWDCAAGTGNLLNGLVNKYHIWASTLDKQDIDVMHDRIKNGANLLEEHVFQFDFLNDDFSKVPKSLQNIINSPDKRKRLIVYINPPYAESSTGIGRSFKPNVSLEHVTHKTYKDIIGKAINELFAQFLARIYDKLPNATLAQFSTLKTIQGPNFANFRQFFQARLKAGFVVPANTFDNVNGKFPIGFFIWDLAEKHIFEKEELDVFNANGVFMEKKTFYAYNRSHKNYINNWLRFFFDKTTTPIGIMHNNKNDFQHNTQVRITSDDIKDHTTPITKRNLLVMCIYLAVRHVIPATWINDRDQFLYPNDSWQTDTEFQNDCLAYSLFHGQNRISAKHGTNNWIPFTEQEVNARSKFDSNFMTQFIKGKLTKDTENVLFNPQEPIRTSPLIFSKEALAVFDAGRALWKYYHAKSNSDPNAALYDIKEYFQGRNEGGKMNARSDDKQYNLLITELRNALKVLGEKIEPKVYAHGFLK